MSRRRYGRGAGSSGRKVGLRSVHLMPRGYNPEIGFHSSEDESLGLLVEDYVSGQWCMIVLGYGEGTVAVRAAVTPDAVDYVVLTYDDGFTERVNW